MSKIIGVTVGTPTSPKKIENEIKPVKTVNRQEPDENGNVEVVGNNGKDGVDGKDGISPTISVSTITGGHRITITDKDGTKTVDVMGGVDGEDGKDGSDGVGIANIAKTSTNGKVDTYTITLTNGTKTTFTVTNGADGKDGDSVTITDVQTDMMYKGKPASQLTFSDGTALIVQHGVDGKTAYAYAQDGGYTGTEAEFAAKIAADNPTMEQFNNLSADVEGKAKITDVFESSLQPLFDNALDTAGIEYGKQLDSQGVCSDTTAPLCVTGYIPVSAGSVIRVNEDFPLARISGKTTPKVVLYDAEYNQLAFRNFTSMGIEGDSGYYVESLATNADGHIVEFRINRPSTTAFMRICNYTEIMGKNPVLSVDQEIKYGEKYGYLLNPKIRVEQAQILNSPQKNGWNILPTEHIAIAYSQIDKTPINTVAHFTNAATNYGYNALKCDVRPTSDGELVCCHDAGFTFDSDGYIATYDSSNQTLIHDVSAATCLGYSFKTGEHPCLVGDYLKICRKYGKVAFITIRNEYMDIVIPKLIEELKDHNMMYSTIINCMTYDSLVEWRKKDKDVMINFTLSHGNAIDKAAIDRAVSLGYCSLCGFSLGGSQSTQLEPTAECDFEYARECGIRVGQAIAYKEGSPEKCFELGYDFCQIGYPWEPITTAGGGLTEDDVSNMINTAIGSAIGSAIGGAY